MTVTVGAVAGTKFYIGPASVDAQAVTSPDQWVEVGDISNLGDLSQNFAEIAVESIGSGDSYNLKGTRSFPNVALTLNRNDSDTGQLAMKTASAAVRGTLYPFKIEEADGGTLLFDGEVFGYGPSYGGVNTLRTIKTSVSVRPDTYLWTPSA